ACDAGAVDKGLIRIEHCQFCLSCVDHCPTSAFRIVDTWKQSERDRPTSVQPELVQLTRRNKPVTPEPVVADAEPR
ncbi:MAG: 4Fe-4S binding protein, partial [Deltaproteobacteria bacterium]|nr:4Fe-4S binding protein [Deltaproteobacteria bacterium]